MMITRKHIGIYDIKEINSIRTMTSFEYIDEIEAVDSPPGKQLYKVSLSDVYTEPPRIKGKCEILDIR